VSQFALYLLFRLSLAQWFFLFLFYYFLNLYKK